jgi:glycosyltransferase involved in cell wall biosynthesis
LSKEGIRHVHVHLANAAVTVAIIASGWGEASCSMSVHGPDVFSDVTTNLLSEKVVAARFVRCISHFCRSQLMRLVPVDEWRKLHIVRCGVDVSDYTPRPEPRNETSELLCVGRLVPAKGQHILVEACKELRDRGVSFHLTFVGDGPDRGSLETRTRELGLADSITFAGAVGQDEVHAYYDRADVFVLASFAEGLPVVLMEAMAKEIPCVTTRITAIPELVVDGLNGLLVAPSDVTGLADAVEQLLRDPGLRRRFGKAARRKVLDEYDNAKNCPAMGELFDQVLDQEHRTEGTRG